MKEGVKWISTFFIILGYINKLVDSEDKMDVDYLSMDPEAIGKYLKEVPITATKKGDLERNLINLVHFNKLNSIRDHIRQILELIRERTNLHHEVLSDFEREIARVGDIISASCESVIRYNTVELRPTRGDLEESIIKLKKAMIDEKVAAWRDVLGLRKELIKLREKLKSAESKSKLFMKK